MSKDAEIERAFKQAEKDAERRERRVFTAPIPIWEDPEPCPACGSDQVFKMDMRGLGTATGWRGSCVDCGWYWDIDNQGENDGT